MNHRHLRRFAASLILLSAITALPASAQWSHEPTENNVVSDAANQQINPKIVSDGAGGTIVGYTDYSVPNHQVVLHRFDRDGHALWGSGVVAHVGINGLANYFDLLADGAGGAFLAMQDNELGVYGQIYAQHVTAAGVAQWGVNGINVCPGGSGWEQRNASLCLDGSGGLLLAFVDSRNGNWDLFGQRLDATGSLLWDTVALGLCTTTGDQTYPVIVPDGTGGFFVVWNDSRNSATTGDDIYTNHYAVDGTPLWATDGNVTCNAAGTQRTARAASDNQGGVVVVWQDERDFGTSNGDLYAQRHVATGQTAFPFNGMPVCTKPELQEHPALVCDTQGRVFIAWSDDRSDSYTGPQIYAQLLSPVGSELWQTDGLMVGGANGTQYLPKLAATSDNNLAVVWRDYREGNYSNIYGQLFSSAGHRLMDYYGDPVMSAQNYQDTADVVADDRGGFVAVGDDWRSFSDSDVYMQRVDRTGYLGDPTTPITRLIDHPQDQGGNMLLEWGRSWLDAYQQPGVYGYTLIRRFAGATKSPPTTLKAGPDSDGPLAEKLASLQKAGWYMIDYVTAMQLPEYGFVVPTFADSTEAGAPVTEYMVITETSGGFIESEVVGGWSVDNLAPGAPLALGAVVAGADVDLEWTGSGYHDEDLLHYNIYRARQPGVVPGVGTFVASSADSLHADTIAFAGEYYYVVTAVDVHGNESPVSNEAMIQGVSAVDGSQLPTIAVINGAWPNPFNPMTTIKFAVPKDGQVRLAVYNVRGSRVRTLVDGAMPAGYQGVDWDGRNDHGGQVASGVYFARLESGGTADVLKVVLAK